MAARKKQENVVKFTEPPVTTYHHSQNRLLIIDWASLSYHLMFSMKNKQNTAAGNNILPEEDELLKWRNLMFGRLIGYIKLFNPKHLVFALEGKRAWRRDTVRKYYEEHADIYYDKSAYYVVADNAAYKVSVSYTDGDGEHYNVAKIPMDSWGSFKDKKHLKLNELPEATQQKLWNVATESGTPVLPSYKGTRKHSDWPFSVNKKVWMDYKDVYATELAPLFRARAVKSDIAEGDDVIYASVQRYAPEVDEIIILTRDSDMSQIDHPKVKIFNHVSDTFTKCANPQQYLAAKILSGDSSDNINGMSFVDKKTGCYQPTCKTKIGEAGALTLLDNCPNIYETAKQNGWDDQYLRNKTLIDLSMVPSDVKKVIMEAVSMPEPEFDGYWSLPNWGINKYLTDEFNTMRTLRYYCFITPEEVAKDPGVFVTEKFKKEQHESSGLGGVETLEADSADGIFSSPEFTDKDADYFDCVF